MFQSGWRRGPPGVTGAGRGVGRCSGAPVLWRLARCHAGRGLLLAASLLRIHGQRRVSRLRRVRLRSRARRYGVRRCSLRRHGVSCERRLPLTTLGPGPAGRPAVRVRGRRQIRADGHARAADRQHGALQLRDFDSIRERPCRVSRALNFALRAIGSRLPQSLSARATGQGAGARMTGRKCEAAVRLRGCGVPE